MDSAKRFWIIIGEPRSDDRPPITTMRHVALTAQNADHQLVPLLRNLTRRYRRFGGVRKTIPGQAWHDDCERILHPTAKPFRMGKPLDQPEKLHHRSGPTMRKD